MTEEIFSDLKDAYIRHLKEMMIEDGALYPVITIFADHVDESDATGAIVHLPIPPEYMQSGETKDEFVDDILPKIAEEVKKKFIPHAVAWSAEAWMRTADMKENGELEPSIEKEEVIIINVETEDNTETSIYKIIRRGMQVDESGLKDPIELEKTMEEAHMGADGRFTGLFKKFKK